MSHAGSAQSRIRLLDQALERNPDAIEPRFVRASLLREQGRFEQAKRDYLALLQRMPTHFGALNDFGTLVLEAGYRDAARTLFAEAVRHHPDNPMGHVNLANLLLRLGAYAEARTHYEAALQLDPDHPHAHRGMGNLLAEIGDETRARHHRDKGFAAAPMMIAPYRGEGTPIGLLQLVSAVGGNIPTSYLLEDRHFQVTTLVAEYHEPNAPLPPHDLVFNSIGDADLCANALHAAQALVMRTQQPVINDPGAVLATGRTANAERLRGLADVVVPRAVALPRRILIGSEAEAAIAGHVFAFPLLVRAPGFHTGRHFVRAADPKSLAAAAAELPGEELYVIEELDARGSDGKFRKYRVMFIEGRLYPLHCAVSHDWKVHYFTADMAHSAEHRAEDERFLARMDEVVGARGIAALERIGATLGLDYAGIDFATNGRGEILFFEANATMVVTAPLSDPKWDYRRAAVENVLVAVRTMLIAHARRPIAA
jgi:glutathione synthase/RimK-type ligase-like ATP-grasp enzyme